MIPETTTNEFSLTNPIADPDYYSVPKLLRRLADHPEEFGDDTTVRDLLLELGEYKDPETHDYYEKLWPSITVYCSRRETALAAKMNYFSMTNPEGEPGRYSVPELLRRVAGRLDELGDNATVSSLITHTEPTREGFAPSANTYYTREDGWVQNFDPQTHELLLEQERYADSQTHEPDEEQKTAMSEPMNYFSMTNPEEGSDRFSVPKLLRLVADRIDELGDDVIVNDLILHIEVTAEGYLPWINVYYYYEKGE